MLHDGDIAAAVCGWAQGTVSFPVGKKTPSQKFVCRIFAYAFNRCECNIIPSWTVLASCGTVVRDDLESETLCFGGGCNATQRLDRARYLARNVFGLVGH